MAINRNVLAGKCKLNAKPRLETMLLALAAGRFSVGEGNEREGKEIIGMYVVSYFVN